MRWDGVQEHGEQVSIFPRGFLPPGIYRKRVVEPLYLACAVGPLPSSSQTIVASACASSPPPPPPALTAPAAGSVNDDMDDKTDVAAGVDVEVDSDADADRKDWRPSSS